ncbi:UNVERIFIED_CONTAM: hypothetical protein GTU68_032754 [Idotea baltica]|nr:hypothetical protein [Idotea baltica]
MANPPAFKLSADTFFQYINYTLGQLIIRYDHKGALLLVCGFIITVFFLKNLFRFLAKYNLAIIRNGVVADLRLKLYDKILALPLAYFSEKKKGDTIARATVDIQEVEWGVLSVLEMMIVSPLNIFVSLLFLFSINAKLTLTVLVITPIAGFLIASIGKSLKKVSMLAQEKMGNILSQLDESMSGLNIIKAFTAEEYFNAKFEKSNREHANLMTKMLHRRDLSSPLSEFLSVSVIIIILYIGTLMVLNNNAIDSAQFITYLVILSQIIPPAKALADAYYRIIKGGASLERIEEIIATPNEIADVENAAQLKSFESEVTFNNISFAYNEKPVLKNINFKIKKGQVVALVGSSGSGKTTLAKLLARFYDVNSGEILIDGKNLKDVSQHSLRQQLGVVSQHPILFNDSVLNNIALGTEVTESTKQHAVEAAIIANAHSFIDKLENGYHTNIGDGGFLLSGGQRQRLTIARAIFNNAPILILDEATSALDSESEQLVQQAINKLLENRTVLVIAHRLSTIRSADLIIVMNEGEIIEQGTHQELLKLKKEYWKMVSLQE